LQCSRSLVQLDRRLVQIAGSTSVRSGFCGTSSVGSRFSGLPWKLETLASAGAPVAGGGGVVLGFAADVAELTLTLAGDVIGLHADSKLITRRQCGQTW
jgi:hypothetical protein